jgi:hypothetical protein
MSHGEPDNYFNMTRYAYEMLLTENDMAIVEEYYPKKFWLTLFQHVYLKLVRNDVYNRRPILKLIQIPVFALSLVISPLINLLALLLDAITPFDRRGYDIYMVLARRRGEGLR